MNDILSIITTVMRASSHRFIGRLARDPEVKYFESGKCVANTRMAVNQLGAKQGDDKEPDWFKVETPLGTAYITINHDEQDEPRDGVHRLDGLLSQPGLGTQG